MMKPTLDAAHPAASFCLTEKQFHFCGVLCCLVIVVVVVVVPPEPMLPYGAPPQQTAAATNAAASHDSSSITAVVREVSCNTESRAADAPGIAAADAGAVAGHQLLAGGCANVKTTCLAPCINNDLASSAA